MIVTILYAVWICYTVTSLSVILGLIALAILSVRDKKKNDERIRQMLTKRPNDDLE